MSDMANRVREWLETAEGTEAFARAVATGEAAVKQIEESSKFDWRMLHQPMTLCLLVMVFVGCATTDTAPRQQQVVSSVTAAEIKTPILQPCIFEDEIPPRPKLWMTESQTKEKRRLASVIDIIELDAYVIAADSKLRGCAKPREVSK